MICFEARLNDLKTQIEKIYKENRRDDDPHVFGDQMKHFWEQIKRFQELYSKWCSMEFTAGHVVPHLETIEKVQALTKVFFRLYRDESDLCDQIMLNHETIQYQIDKAKYDLCTKLTPDTKSLIIFGSKNRINTIIDFKKKCPDTATFIQNQSDDEIYDLPPNLEELILSDCVLSEPLLKQVASLTQLCKLSLTKCDSFQDDHFKFLCDLKHLEEFFCDSRTTGAGLIYLYGASHLKRLDMRITPVTLHLLKCFTELKSLHIYGCALAPESMKQVANLTQLKELIIDNAGHKVFVDDSARHLTTLKHLESLCIESCNGISNVCLEHVGEITSLKKLRLHRSTIDYQGLGHLLSCKYLESLTLSAITVTNQGLHKLKYVPNLKHLTLTNADINIEDIKILIEFPVLETVTLKFYREEEQKKAAAFGKEHGIDIQCV